MLASKDHNQIPAGLSLRAGAVYRVALCRETRPAPTPPHMHVPSVPLLGPAPPPLGPLLPPPQCHSHTAAVATPTIRPHQHQLPHRRRYLDAALLPAAGAAGSFVAGGAGAGAAAAVAPAGLAAAAVAPAAGAAAATAAAGAAAGAAAAAAGLAGSDTGCLSTHLAFMHLAAKPNRSTFSSMTCAQKTTRDKLFHECHLPS